MALAGAGTQADPYQIWTALDLNDVRNHLTSYIIQKADIDLLGWDWIPIGTPTTPFMGYYDGDYHKITNLEINLPTTSNVGLFGVAGKTSTISNGYIKNLIIVDASVTGYTPTGIICGALASSTTIENCKASGNVTGKENSTGAIAGKLGNASCCVIKCCSFAVVNSTLRAGGIVGYSSFGIVENCYSRGNVTVSTLDTYTGGVVGRNSGTITNCYNTGIPQNSGGVRQGGVVGISTGTVVSCYYDTETSGCSDTGKGDPKNTDQMKTQSTYVDWDFNTVWAIHPELNDGYPYLQWENLSPPTPPVPIEVLPAYSPQSTIKLEFSAGDSVAYPMGVFYADKSQYKVGSAGPKIDARNSIGKYLKDQTFDEKGNFPSQSVTTMIESMLSGAGLTKYYVQPSTIQMGMNFAPNKDILGGIEEILQYLLTWQIREEVDGTVVVAARTDSHFTQPSRYTFQRDRDIFSRDVVTDDRSIYGRVCVHTSDWLVRVYRPITSDLGWTPPAQKTLYQQVPDGTTSLEAANIATNLAASMANSGKVETFVCPFRPMIFPGDEAAILEADESATMIGVITQVKHSFGVQGFFTEIVVDSGGRIGKPKFKEIVNGLKPLPTSKKVN